MQVMSDAKDFPTKLFWVDLEMTGLDVKNDVILEIAAEITDFDFNPIASYEARVHQDKQLVETRLMSDPWWSTVPENRDDFIQKLADGKPSEQVEQELVALIAEHFGDEPAILAGNSIHNDRNFIKQWWPALDAKLHYRMLDVSSFKILMQGKYGVEFQKKKAHRAFDDIHESIAELQDYLGKFKVL